MATSTPIFKVSTLIKRIELVLLSPKECWRTISKEDDTSSTIFYQTVLPLLVLGTIFSQIGSLGPFRTAYLQPSVVRVLALAAIAFALQIVSLYVGAWLIQKLSAIFHGAASPQKAFSLLAHSVLPILVGGVLGFFPPIIILPIFLILIAVAIYCFCQGIPSMTTVPEGSRLFFTGSFIVSMLVFTTIVNLITLPLVFWLMQSFG